MVKLLKAFFVISMIPIKPHLCVTCENIFDKCVFGIKISWEMEGFAKWYK